MRPSFFHHIHPPTIPAKQSRWRYTLGAGGTAVYLVLVLVFTGALEMFYYIPTPDHAALSVQTITYLVPFGWLVRNLHFWAAQLFLVVITVHLIRIVFTGAYSPPRRFNYLLGLCLFVLAILLDFTGYILRWDTGIRWALVVGTNLLKSIPAIGPTVYEWLVGETGSITLIRFYAWHIFGLTLGMVILTVWHAFRVRRDGGIAVPPPELRSDQTRISRVELVQREILAMVYTTAALLLLSTFFPAPIAASLSLPLSIETPLQAPWFLLWVQVLLKWGSPFLMGVLVPLMILGIMIFIPYVFPRPREAELGQWFIPSNRLAQAVLAFILAAIIVLTLLSFMPAA